MPSDHDKRCEVNPMTTYPMGVTVRNYGSSHGAPSPAKLKLERKPFRRNEGVGAAAPTGVETETLF